MLARCSLVLILATAVFAPPALSQVTEEGTAEVLKAAWIPECAPGKFPVPMNFAGMEVRRAQAVLDHNGGGLQIAIAVGGCDSLKEPSESEQRAIIMGPASPCGDPGTCIPQGGLVGVVLQPPGELPIIKLILIAALTALIVAIGVGLVLRRAS